MDKYFNPCILGINFFKLIYYQKTVVPGGVVPNYKNKEDDKLCA